MRSRVVPDRPRSTRIPLGGMSCTMRSTGGRASDSTPPRGCDGQCAAQRHCSSRSRRSPHARSAPAPTRCSGDFPRPCSHRHCVRRSSRRLRNLRPVGPPSSPRKRASAPPALRRPLCCRSRVKSRRMGAWRAGTLVSTSGETSSRAHGDARHARWSPRTSGWPRSDSSPPSAGCWPGAPEHSRKSSAGASSRHGSPPRIPCWPPRRRRSAPASRWATRGTWTCCACAPSGCECRRSAPSR
jgi:hypothetical protein